VSEESVSGKLLPVVRGDGWFEAEGRPFVLRVECPLSVDEVVAALYGVVEPGDIATDEDLCGSVAVTLLLEGARSLRERVGVLRQREQLGAVESVAFLAACRERVLALLGGEG
jgi:hypothetical protein